METYDLAIIGTGSGNAILDHRFADKRVALCEQGTFGGTCLNVGCIHTKAMLHASELAWHMRTAAEFGLVSGAPAVDGPAFFGRVNKVDSPMRSL